MRLSATDSRIGSGGTIVGDRQHMSREVEVTLRTQPRWGGASRGMIDSVVIGEFTCSAKDARILARALVAEARIVEAARR
jgi:hypothetical protein